MKRIAYRSWIVVASLVFTLLLPFFSTSETGVEGVPNDAGRRSVLVSIITLIGRILTRYERWSRERLRRRIDQFIAEYCDPVWAKDPKKGFLRLGSSKAQTVLEHRISLEARFRREALREGFSPDEITRGVYQIRVHEMDEVITRDRLRLKLPHLKVQRESYVEEEWRPDEDWIPTRPGDVSPSWRRGYKEGRPIAYKLLRRRVGRRFANRVIVDYDDFHIGMDRVSVLARDNHYAETIEEAIREGVPARHFALEARYAIANPRIRAEVDQEYEEGVVFEKEPLEHPSSNGGGSMQET